MFRLLFLLVFTQFLIACATRPAISIHNLEQAGGWEQQKSRIEKLERWQVRGRLAYKRENEGFSASIKWQQMPQQTSLKLSNTLGITLVNLDIMPNKAVLEADGETFTDASAEQLLLNNTGWDIPVDAFSHWIKALPNDDDKFTLNDQGFIEVLRPSCFRCRRWEITYHSYTLVDGLVLPSSITVTDITQQNAFIKLRLSKWQ